MPDFEISRTSINGVDYVIPSLSVSWGKVRRGEQQPESDQQSTATE